MHYKKKSGLALLMALILFTLTACGGMFSSGKERTYTEEELAVQETFDAYTEQIFVDSVTADIISLHYTLKDPAAFGITEYTPTLGEYSLEYFEEGMAESKTALDELKAINRDSLTKNQQLTYDILLSVFETDLTSEGMIFYSGSLSPVTGVQVQLPVLLAEYEFNTERDVTDYLTALAELDTYYGKIGEFERKRSEAGMFMSDRVADNVIKGCQDFLSTGENNYLIDVFDERIDALEGLTDDAKASYKEQNKTVIAEHVVPAYQNLIAVLEELKGTGTNDKGLFYYDRGTEFYEYLIKARVGSSRSGDELMEMIEENLNNDLRLMAKAMGKNPDLAENAFDFQYASYDPKEIIEDLKVKLAEDFPALPEAEYSIKYVHKSLEESMSPAFYITPPIDDSNRNVIYINQAKLTEDSSGLYTTLAHEGYPGHLYQNVYFNQVDACNLRRCLSFTGYSEGWASYVEYHSYQYADGMDPDTAQFLAANSSASLALYAYLDMAINYKGWDIAETKEFLLQYYGINDDSIIEEVFYTMVADPASYLKYYVGYLEILDLRDTMQETLGKKFVLKDFHEQLLTVGPAPFSVIQDYMNQWAETVK